MARMLTSQRINHSGLWDWPNCPNDILLSHWCLSSQSWQTTRFQTSGYVTDYPFREFFIGGHEKDSVRKGGPWFSLRASHPVFSLINFLFLPECPAHSLFLCTHLTFWCWNPGRSTATGWAPLTSPPLVGPSLGPYRETGTSSGMDSPLALLDWHPHTGPHFTHRSQGWVISHSLGSSLLLS